MIFSTVGSYHSCWAIPFEKAVLFYIANKIQDDFLLGIDYSIALEQIHKENYEKTADFIVKRFEERGWKTLGEKQNISLDKVRTIVKMSY